MIVFPSTMNSDLRNFPKRLVQQGIQALLDATRGSCRCGVSLLFDGLIAAARDWHLY
jgi:hypothetical protein